MLFVKFIHVVMCDCNSILFTTHLQHTAHYISFAFCWFVWCGIMRQCHKIAYYNMVPLCNNTGGRMLSPIWNQGKKTNVFSSGKDEQCGFHKSAAHVCKKENVCRNNTDVTGKRLILSSMWMDFITKYKANSKVSWRVFSVFHRGLFDIRQHEYIFLELHFYAGANLH